MDEWSSRSKRGPDVTRASENRDEVDETSRAHGDCARRYRRAVVRSGEVILCMFGQTVGAKKLSRSMAHHRAEGLDSAEMDSSLLGFPS